MWGLGDPHTLPVGAGAGTATLRSRLVKLCKCICHLTSRSAPRDVLARARGDVCDKVPAALSVVEGHCHNPGVGH